MNRRDFLKTIGGGAVASSALLSACTGRTADRQTPAESREPDGSLMTYRTNPNTGDRVSLLGYGMMRLPVEGGASGRENSNAPIDQDMQPSGGLCPRARCQLFRYIARLLPGAFRACHEYRHQPSPTVVIFYCHQTLQFQPLYVESPCV